MFPQACRSARLLFNVSGMCGRVGIVASLASSTLMIPGCQPHMVDQPRVGTLQSSAAFRDGLGQRPTVAGTIARGELPTDSSEETGLVDGKALSTNPLELSEKLLNRGQQRFKIYCSPCHGAAGFGDGMVVQRGFPAPPSYHIDRLRSAPDGELFRVISRGRGRMPPFGKRLEVKDRWAIVAYIRALQLSQSADLTELPEGDRRPFIAGEGGLTRE